ncbi:MAG: molybdopterin molybdotransferase MoeA [Lachnospiraceae bacterium]|nr:molybdopterin molybdotransferase MoeA [Lachnospiraceae bacterium]
MLEVKSLEEAIKIIDGNFKERSAPEAVSLSDALGRILFEDIVSTEFVPGFDRSTVDGFAVRASDTFGCSDSIPAILDMANEIKMGESTDVKLQSGRCMAVPTGGALPEGADSVVMIEYTEDYKDGTIGILKPSSPGMNVIFKGDDVTPGKVVIKKGKVLSPSDIGALAAMGFDKVNVKANLKVAVISTGDELVKVSDTPLEGQMRDVNSAMVSALIRKSGATPVEYGIIKDDESLLLNTVKDALLKCDAVVISGGSSVGTKDASVRVIESCGELLLHGLAVKPGKPTILGKAGDKAIVGLPGHPVAAFFVFEFMLTKLLCVLQGKTEIKRTARAILTESVGANDGRAHFIGAKLSESGEGLLAEPIRTKSGLITSLSTADGYFVIPRDCEGYEKGKEIEIKFFS